MIMFLLFIVQRKTPKDAAWKTLSKMAKKRRGHFCPRPFKCMERALLSGSLHILQAYDA